MDVGIKSLMFANIPALVFVLIYFVRMEKKITRLETCLEMLIKRLDRCRPHSGEPT